MYNFRKYLVSKEVEKYLKHKLESDNSEENTLKAYHHSFYMLEEVIEKDTIDTTKEDIISFLSNYSDGSYNLHIINFKSFFKYYNMETIKDLNTKVLQKKDPVYLNKKQIDKLLSTIEESGNKRDYALILMYIHTGLRLNELLNLKLSSILNGKKIRVINSKSKKEYNKPLSDKAYKALKDYLKVRPESESDYVFLSNRKTRISESTVQRKILKKYLELAKLPLDIHIHSLRHSHAMRLRENGADILTIKESLGHESLQSTMVYTRSNESEQRSYVNKI